MTGNDQLFAAITSFADKKGDELCVIETITDDRITYRELQRAVADMQELIGVSPKTVMVALPGGIVDAVIWLSCLIGGHVLLPVSPNITEHEYDDLLSKHTIDILFVDTTSNNHLKHKKTITLEDCYKVIKRDSDGLRDTTPHISQQEGKVILYTSGSTGKPKGITLTTTQIMLTAQNIRKSHQLTEADCGLTPLPFFHVNAPIVSLITSIISGGTVIIAPKFSITNFWRWVEKYDPTWISVVPTIITILLQTERPQFLDKASLRFIRTASAPLPAVTLRKFEGKFNIPLIETYGITEAASTITANPVPPGLHKPGSVGLPINVSLCISKTSDKSHTIESVPLGTTGEICVKGPNVIDSYEHGTGKSSFQDGWFRTGDLGFVDSDGYIYITGRIKDIINRGGEIIAPREIEEVLLTHPDVQDTVVVGHPDQIYGEQVVAFVVVSKQSDDKKAEEKIKIYTAEKLSPQKVPAKIIIIDELPKGRTGKIDKQALRDYKQ